MWNSIKWHLTRWAPAWDAQRTGRNFLCEILLGLKVVPLVRRYRLLKQRFKKPSILMDYLEWPSVALDLPFYGRLEVPYLLPTTFKYDGLGFLDFSNR